LGEHTEALLGALCDVPPEDVAKLKLGGVV